MKALVLTSGGVDSTTCLAIAVDRFGAENCVALSVFYGQKHDRELQSAKAMADYYGVEYISIDLTTVFQYSNCSLLSHSTEDIPEKSYKDQLAESGGSPVSTYVPFRNGLFISVAASIAISRGCGEIYYGAHMDDDNAAYPDCSKEFWQAMNAAICEGSGRQLRLIAPFIGCGKSEIVRQGLALGVPYELTWSCYEGGSIPCGKCGTCLDREAAFAANGVEDPLITKLRAEGKLI